MTSEECTHLYFADITLRQYIKRYAQRRSCNKEDKEDFMQEAWMHIAESPAGKSTDWYCNIARQAIYNEWRRNYRYRKRMKRLEFWHKIGQKPP